MAKYIERRRLFNALADYWKIPLDWDGGIAQPCEDALAFIENAPEEDVAPVVHGRWIWNEECHCWVCSNCYLSALNNYRGWSTESNYCPNCGAKMDGEGK